MDFIRFTLVGGEPLPARAVRPENGGTLYIAHRCLHTSARMNPADVTDGGYAASGLRAWLMGKVLPQFPADVRSLLIPSAGGDLLRVPSMAEIFGGLFPGINRMAMGTYNGKECVRMYWLQDVVSPTHFAIVDACGGAGAYRASGALGVRIVFCLRD